MEHNRTPFKQPDSVVKVGVIAGSETPKLAPSGYTGTITYEYFKKIINQQKHIQMKN